MVATEEGDAVGILDFEAEQVLEGFDGVVAAIYEVADEDVAGLVNLSA